MCSAGPVHHLGASLVAQSVKKLPAVQETWVQSLGQEDPLEKEMATHSSILAWRIPWTEEPGGLHTVHGVARVEHGLVTKPPPARTLRSRERRTPLREPARP